jgi:hypothetical protein
MEATRSSEMSVDFQRTTWRFIPIDRTIRNHLCEMMRSYRRFYLLPNLHCLLQVSYHDLVCSYRRFIALSKQNNVMFQLTSSRNYGSNGVRHPCYIKQSHALNSNTLRPLVYYSCYGCTQTLKPAVDCKIYLILYYI